MQKNNDEDKNNNKDNDMLRLNGNFAFVLVKISDQSACS